MISTHDLKPEERLLLYLCGEGPLLKAYDAIKLPLPEKSAFDYEIVLKLAGINEVLPMLHISLEGNCDMSENAKSRLQNAYLYTVRKNVLQAGEMVGLLLLFEQKGIEAIPLKGAIASDTIFGDPGFYPSTDIDILVKPVDMPAAEKILKERGYSKTEGASDEDLLSGHYHLIFSKENCHVELHWNLVKRYFHVPPEFWWKGLGTARYSGIQIKTLAPEKYLMYAIFRLFDHGFRPLKFFIFVMGLIQKYKDSIDWERFFLYVREYKMERIALFVLQLLNELYNIRLPYNCKSVNSGVYMFLKKQVLSGWFSETQRPHLRMVLYTFLLDTPVDFSKALAKRFFPDMGEIRLRYGLPYGSGKAYGYYILNPLLVMMKRR